MRKQKPANNGPAAVIVALVVGALSIIGALVGANRQSKEHVDSYNRSDGRAVKSYERRPASR